jgi:hypothetical protein
MTNLTEFRRLHTDPLCDYIDQLDSDGIFLDEIIMDNGIDTFYGPSPCSTDNLKVGVWELSTDKFVLQFVRHFYEDDDGENWEGISENFYIAGSSKAAKKYLTTLLETTE